MISSQCYRNCDLDGLKFCSVSVNVQFYLFVFHKHVQEMCHPIGNSAMWAVTLFTCVQVHMSPVTSKKATVASL